MVAEIAVIVKNDDKTLTSRFLEYEPFQLKNDDPVLKNYIDEALKNFGDSPESVRIRINMEIQ